jgi:hypothetical protein
MLAAFKERDGRPTLVTLRDGRSMTVHNIAWGYDDGDEWAHVTSNISPAVVGAPIDFFYTSDVLRLDDAETGAAAFSS